MCESVFLQELNFTGDGWDDDDAEYTAAYTAANDIPDLYVRHQRKSLRFFLIHSWIFQAIMQQPRVDHPWFEEGVCAARSRVVPRRYHDSIAAEMNHA